MERFQEMGALLLSIVAIETNDRFIVRVLYGRRGYMTILFGEPTQDGENE